MQVVRPGPDVDEHQGPEVHDRQLVAEDRAAGRLRQVVVHEPEVGRREEEGDRVVPVPPLHEGVLHPRVGRVAPEERVRHRHAVADVQDRDRDDRGDVEPDRDVEVLLAADREGSEEVDGEDHPQHGDQDVEHPRQLGVLLALGHAEDERQRGPGDEQLPAPEVDPREGVAPQARLQQALDRVVDPAEDHAAHEGEDRRVRVQRAQPAERQVRRHVQAGKEQHGRHQHAHEHGDHRPHDRGDEEEARGLVVVPDGVAHRVSILSVLSSRPRRRAGGLWFGARHAGGLVFVLPGQAPAAAFRSRAWRCAWSSRNEIVVTTPATIT